MIFFIVFSKGLVCRGLETTNESRVWSLGAEGLRSAAPRPCSRTPCAGYVGLGSPAAARSLPAPRFTLSGFILLCLWNAPGPRLTEPHLNMSSLVTKARTRDACLQVALLTSRRLGPSSTRAHLCLWGVCWGKVKEESVPAGDIHPATLRPAAAPRGDWPSG